MFSAMYYMVTNYVLFAERTLSLAAVTVFVALVHIPLAYALIVLNGGVGAAQATAISLAMSFVLTWVVSNRAFPMPWFRREQPGE
jgi:Na+-driven multidrug efflux pump